MCAKVSDVRVPTLAPTIVAPSASLENSGRCPGKGGGGVQKDHHLGFRGVRFVKQEAKRCDAGRREIRMWWKGPCRPARPARKAVVLILLGCP